MKNWCLHFSKEGGCPEKMNGVKQLRTFLILLLTGFLLIGCNRKEMPALEDGKKLQQDCIRLLLQYPQGDLPETAWPRSIKALKPIRVTREENKIRIFARQERGKYTVGYDVFADPQLAPSTKGVWVQKTKFKGVYIFKMPY